jgi:hypothetical protein
MSESDLQTAINHVAAARRTVESQKAQIAELRRDGHFTRRTEELLQAYESSLILFEQDLGEVARLRKALRAV